MKRTLEHLLKKELEVDVPVKSATILGQRISLAASKGKENKTGIVKNKSELRKTIGETIYVDDDSTLKERQAQRKFRKTVAGKGKREIK